MASPTSVLRPHVPRPSSKTPEEDLQAAVAGPHGQGEPGATVGVARARIASVLAAFSASPERNQKRGRPEGETAEAQDSTSTPVTHTQDQYRVLTWRDEHGRLLGAMRGGPPAATGEQPESHVRSQALPSESQPKKKQKLTQQVMTGALGIRRLPRFVPLLAARGGIKKVCEKGTNTQKTKIDGLDGLHACVERRKTAATKVKTTLRVSTQSSKKIYWKEVTTA